MSRGKRKREAQERARRAAEEKARIEAEKMSMPGEPPQSGVLKKVESKIEDNRPANPRSCDHAPPKPAAVAIDRAFAAAVAFAAIVQGIVAIFGLSAMKDQNGIIIEQNKHIAEQVKLARKGAEQTDKVLAQMQLEQRPWIAIEVPEIGELVAGEKPICTFTAKNTGKTPAFIIDHLIGGTIVPSPPVGGQLFADWEAVPNAPARPEHNIAFAPEFFCNFEEELPAVTDRDISDINTGSKTFLILLRFRYLDVIGKEHKTTGCFLYSHKSKDFGAYEKYNHMD